jgi:hypothetical protein
MNSCLFDQSVQLYGLVAPLVCAIAVVDSVVVALF